VRYLTLLGLMTVMAIGSARGQPRVFVAMPNGEPVMASEAGTASLPLPQRIDALVAGLGHAEYHERKANREALKALLIQEGRSAYDMLNTDRYRQDDDPEIALTIKEVLASTADAIIPTLNMDAITRLVAKGLTPQTLGALNAGGKPVADAMLRAHLQMTLGVDVLYSLQPRHLLPEACRLLALQHEDYYRVLITKAIEGVLARAIKPVDGGQAVTLDGMAHFEAHPDAARMLVALTTNACDELRLSALRICAYGQIPLPPSRVKRLQTDINPDVADEATRLHALLLPHTIRHRDATVHDVWIAACVAALTQKDDLLAQLGAYNALTCLIDHRPAALYAAYAQAEGLAKEALGYILSTTLSGRLTLLKHNQQTRIRLHPPHALNRILSLWDYDVKLKGLEGLIDTEREAVAPLTATRAELLRRSSQALHSPISPMCPFIN
jgi:hypothetical protein